MPATTTTSALARSTRRPVRVMGGLSLTRNAIVYWNLLCGKQFPSGFAAAHQVRRRSVHENLGGPRAGVVIRTHRHAVGARRHDREQIALAGGQSPLFRKEIRAFA